MKLGRLRDLRLRAALSQQNLAAISQVAKSTIIYLEQGKSVARPSTMRKLAEALGVKPEELM